MEAWILKLIILILVGVVGATCRQFGQWIRDGHWPGKDSDTPLYGVWWVELALGGVAGWIAWELTVAPVDAVTELFPDLAGALLKLSRIMAWALGFVFPDVMELLAKRLWPIGD